MSARWLPSSANQRSCAPPGSPLRTPARCPDPWRAGFRRARPSPARPAHKGRAARRGRLLHALLGDDRGLARQRAELARDHGGDVARADALGEQRRPRPAAASPRRRRARARPPPGRSRRRARPLRRRAGAADRAPTARRSRVPASSITPRWRIFSRLMRADGAIDEGVGRDRRERPAHELLDRQLERVSALDRQRAQHVALGDDAGVSGRTAFPASRPAAATKSEETRSLDQARQRLAQRPVRRR